MGAYNTAIGYSGTQSSSEGHPPLISGWANVGGGSALYAYWPSNPVYYWAVEAQDIRAQHLRSRLPFDGDRERNDAWKVSLKPAVGLDQGVVGGKRIEERVLDLDSASQSQRTGYENRSGYENHSSPPRCKPRRQSRDPFDPRVDRSRSPSQRRRQVAQNDRNEKHCEEGAVINAWYNVRAKGHAERVADAMLEAG